METVKNTDDSSATNESSEKLYDAAGAECYFGLRINDCFTKMLFHNFLHWFGWNFLILFGESSFGFWTDGFTQC